MQKHRLVALYGSSLLMDIVEATLGDNPSLDVVRVEGSSSGAVDNLRSLHPDMIVVDSSDPDAQFVLSFFKDRAGVPLLCLDPNCNKAMVLSCQHFTSLTTAGLSDLIYSQVGGTNGHNNRSEGVLFS